MTPVELYQSRSEVWRELSQITKQWLYENKRKNRGLVELLRDARSQIKNMEATRKIGKKRRLEIIESELDRILKKDLKYRSIDDA